MTSNDLLDDFTRLGVATVRAKISSAEFGMETLPLVDHVQKEHDVTRYCKLKDKWQLKCQDHENCQGKILKFKKLQHNFKITLYTGCNSNVVECIHHITYYTVGLVGLNILYLLPWVDPDMLYDSQCFRSGRCLPEDIDLKLMTSTGVGM